MAFRRPTPSAIDETIYTRDLPTDKCFTAKQAKELFFLTPDDLKGLEHVRDKGYGSYMMKTGGCKFYNCRDVRNLALRVWHSADNLTLKARAKNERAAKRAQKESLKRVEEERLRREAVAATQRRLVALAEAKKTAAADRKRKREQDATDVESWGKLVAILGESQLPVVEPSEVHKLVEDAMAWRRQCASRRIASRVSEDGVNESQGDL